MKRTFYSFKCNTCNDFGIGRLDDGVKFVAIFESRTLAEIELSNFDADKTHPLEVCRITIDIVP